MRKPKVVRSFRLSQTILDKIRDHSENFDKSDTDIVEEALEEYFAKRERARKKDVQP